MKKNNIKNCYKLLAADQILYLNSCLHAILNYNDYLQFKTDFLNDVFFKLDLI